jgi:peptidoglycan/LPS O-acetylase OafA/YrhL
MLERLLKSVPQRSSSARRDIQGLRACAVLAVILNHLTGWPRGGFVGVDIFFVISGFLIMGILVREQENKENISLVGFYRRRVKRILPAALLVLLVTTVASYMTFNVTRAGAIRIDSVWAAIFGANWRFMSLSTDYFTAGGPTSPVQHYWSLSIEEQFYFVWPWLMLLIFTLIGSSRGPRYFRIVVGVAMLVIIVGSFTWAMMETSGNPPRAYFDTFARVWELGVGALLAVVGPVVMRLPEPIRSPMAWVGLAGMLASLWLVDADNGFPAPWAALPVLSTAVVIAAGTFKDHRRQQRLFFPVTNVACTYVGDISYSLYLWHFPIIVLGTALVGDAPLDKLGIAVVIALASVFSYHLVEDPVRRSTLFERRRHGSRSSATLFPDESVRGYGYILIACLACIAVALVAVALQPAKPPKSIKLDEASAARHLPTATAAPALPKQAHLQAQIEEAVQAGRWPKTSPSINTVLAGQAAPDDLERCSERIRVNESTCRWGAANPRHTAVIVGDSISVMWTPALRKMLASMPTWRLYLLGAFGCPFVDVGTHTRDGPSPRCAARDAAAVAAIKRLHPDVLFVSHTAFFYAINGQRSSMSEEQWASHLVGQINKVKASVHRTVILAAPPPDRSLEDCYTPRSVPADCVGSVTEQWSRRATTERGVASQVGALWMDTSVWFCSQGYCPATVGSEVVKFDTTHITPGYGARIAPVIREALISAKVLPSP